MDARALNLEKHNLLLQNKFFNHEFTNMIGLEFYKYLTQSSYYDLINPQMVDLTKNTLSRNFNLLKVIDEFINKPLNEYTQRDLMNFIESFRAGKLNIKRCRVKNGKVIVKEDKEKTRKVDNISRYLTDFRRFWRIYREWSLNNEKDFNYKKFEWGLKLKAPKVKKVYEDYPYLSVQQLKTLSDSMNKFEYKVRTLLSVNLMARKIEMNNLRYKDVEIREDDSIWIKLPDMKLMSHNKVSVELYSFVKTEFEIYLKTRDWNDDDYLFQSNEFAYAKILRTRANEMFNKKINPKTLRKIGVAIAEQLGIQRDDIERIGGWSVNSPVLSHYFSRHGVSTNKASRKADNELNNDIRVQYEKQKNDLQSMRFEMDQMRKEFLKIVAEKEKMNLTKEVISSTIKAVRDELSQK